MTTALTAVESTAVAPADNDSRLIEMFVGTKRSAHTRTQYANSIAMLQGVVQKPLAVLSLHDAIAYHDWLKEQYGSAHTIKLHVNVAKSLLSFALSINYVRSNVFAPIKPDTPSEVTHHRILSEEQVLKLIDAPKRQRDKLLLRLIYAAGLRVGEVCKLVWGDVLDNGVLHIRSAKGQKDRFVTLSDGMVQRLLHFREDAADSAPVFVSQKGGQLDASQVHRIVKSAANAAGIRRGCFYALVTPQPRQPQPRPRCKSGNSS